MPTRNVIWQHFAHAAWNAMRLTSHCRRALIVFAFILIIGHGIQPADAQDGQPATITYYMDITNVRTSICVGQTVTYHVNILARVIRGGDTLGISNVTHAEVNASGYDPGILTDSPQLQSPKSSLLISHPFTSDFQFTAIAPGRTTIYFDGVVHAQPRNFVTPSTFPVQFEVPVRVVPCNISVRLNARWATTMGPTSQLAIAIIPDGHMSGDAEGYYSGKADMILVIRSKIPSCGYSTTVVRSIVTLRGRLNTDNQIVTTLTFPKMSGDEVGSGTNCYVANAGGNIQLSGLTVTVPTSGGVVSVPQTLSNPLFEVTSLVDVYVFPEPSR